MKRFEIVRKIICPYLHAMNDFGFASPERQAKGEKYSKSRTNEMECYRQQEGLMCPHNGKCLKVVIEKNKKEKKHVGT